MLWFFAVALLATMVTGPLGYGSQMYVIDRIDEGLWHFEALSDDFSFVTKKIAHPDVQEGDVVKLVTAGSVVLSVIPMPKHTRARQIEMEKLLSVALQSEEKPVPTN